MLVETFDDIGQTSYVRAARYAPIVIRFRYEYELSVNRVVMSVLFANVSHI